MASAWGNSWGRAWGNSWGTIVETITLPPRGGGGSGQRIEIIDYFKPKQPTDEDDIIIAALIVITEAFYGQSS